MLSDRRRVVLKMLINEYIAHALPIGSRTLIDRYQLDISSATVRNELMRLEDAGYLKQPHTSAGRIPTDFGYRLFVDDLLASLPEKPSAVMLRKLRQEASELDNQLEKTSQVLARFTNCLAMIVPNARPNISVSRITLVNISPARLVLVVVGEDGSVANRPIDTAEVPNAEPGAEISPDRVAKIERALNELYAGVTISQSATNAQDSYDAHRAAVVAEVTSDPLFLLVEEELLRCCTEQKASHAHTLGLSHLLDQPEFSEASRLAPLIQKLEDETILFNLASDALESDLPIVRIGHENSSKELSQVSVVATPYEAPGGEGMIAIIGPTRMNYEVVVKAVRAAKTLLQNPDLPQ